MPHRRTAGGDYEARQRRGAESELVRRAKAGDDRALGDLLTAYEPFIRWLVRNRAPAAVPFEDLMQAGKIGLIQAVRRYEPERGVQLSTFAKQWIEGEIQRALREGFLIKLPARKAALLARSEAIVERFRRERGEKPSADELAEALGVDLSAIAEFADVAATVVGGMAGWTPESEESWDPLEELEADRQLTYTASEVERLLKSYAELWGRLEGSRAETQPAARRTRGRAEGELRSRLIDLERALERLPEDLDSAVELVALYGLSFEEAGEWLGVHANTVRYRFRRAVTAIAAFLNGEKVLPPREGRRSWRTELRAIENIVAAVRAYEPFFEQLAVLAEDDEFFADLEVGWVQMDDQWVPLFSRDIDATARAMRLSTRPLPPA